jgi:drug/metabolite transporter (DMT)-like permease
MSSQHPQAPRSSGQSRLHPSDNASGAKLLVVLLAFAWGFNWIATAIGLREVPPWSLRFAGAGIGAAILFAAAFVTGHKLHVPRDERIHIMIAGFLNVAGFQVLSAFAQVSGATERVVIINYSMPIWATIFSYVMLRERLNGIRVVALCLCIAGLTILIWPLVAGGIPHSVLYSLGCALTWAFATVYIKCAKVKTEPLVNAAWQLAFGFLFIAAGTFVFESYPRLWPLHREAALAVLFVGVFGVGLAHFLWWSIVDKVSPITASIGSLLVPVVAVAASAVVLGERLTVPDLIGFVMIFAAAACVLLQPNVKHTEMPE